MRNGNAYQKGVPTIQGDLRKLRLAINHIFRNRPLLDQPLSPRIGTTAFSGTQAFCLERNLLQKRNHEDDAGS